MYVWTLAGEQAAAAPHGEPNSLLRHLTGEFAVRIAGLWPSPHAAFIGADADRRHLVCLALGRTDGQLAAEAAEIALTWPFKRAVKALVPDAPSGLARALAHLGERAWPAEDYGRLVDLLGTEATARAIRHAKRIPLAQVQALSRLPAALREAGFDGADLTADRAQLFAETFEALRRREGEDAAARMARGWAAGTSVNDRLERARMDLIPEFPQPPFPGSDRLKVLPDKAALRDAAARYRNCLANYLINGARGESAFYEWTGEPAAVIEIGRDFVHGWVLDQARCVGNEEVPEPARSAIIAELRSWGVHVGRDGWALDRALGQAQASTFSLRAQDSVIEDLFCD